MGQEEKDSAVQAEKDSEVQAGSEEQEQEDEEESTKRTHRKVCSPHTPSIKEREEHELTHWPYRSWCDACVKARAVGQPHKSMTGEHATSSVARVLMDYGFLHEEETVQEGEHGKQVESKVSVTVMLMLETLCSSVWVYVIDGKGASSVDWLAQQVVDDIETVGLAKDRIITKTDQEPQ